MVQNGLRWAIVVGQQVGQGVCNLSARRCAVPMSGRGGAGSTCAQATPNRGVMPASPTSRAPKTMPGNVIATRIAGVGQGLSQNGAELAERSPHRSSSKPLATPGPRPPSSVGFNSSSPRRAALHPLNQLRRLERSVAGAGAATEAGAARPRRQSGTIADLQNCCDSWATTERAPRREGM
jgi:hypothetical protein